jgi:hypothetical protein
VQLQSHKQNRFVEQMALAVLQFLRDRIMISAGYSILAFLYMVSYLADKMVPYLRKRIPHETAARLTALSLAIASIFAAISTTTSVVSWLSSSSSVPVFLSNLYWTFQPLVSRSR